MRRVSWPERRPRVYKGEAREKVLLFAQLSYAFLLTLLKTSYDLLRLWLLRSDNHCTGRHCRAAKMPLTRLRCQLPSLLARRCSQLRLAFRLHPSRSR